MPRWSLLTAFWLTACVHEVGPWPTDESTSSSPSEAAAGADISSARPPGSVPSRNPTAGSEDPGQEDGTREGGEAGDGAPRPLGDESGGGAETHDSGASAGETPASHPCEGASCDWPAAWVALEREVWQRVNERRTQGASCADEAFPPVDALGWHENLAQAARGHSLDMGEQAYFAHDSIDGRSPWERMRDADFTGAPVAENIAAGNHTAADVVEAWMNSPGHCRNIMSRRATLLGVGYAHVAGSPYGHYWTQAFGTQ